MFGKERRLFSSAWLAAAATVVLAGCTTSRDSAVNPPDLGQARAGRAPDSSAAATVPTSAAA